MTYTLDSIKEITKEKIIYFDHNNLEQSVNLLDCSKNWVEQFNKHIHEYRTWECGPAPEKSIESNTCVGERNWSAERPFFEFYSRPKIRFEIRPKKWITDFFVRDWRHSRGYYSQFHKITLDLEKFGWTTFDLS